MSDSPVIPRSDFVGPQQKSPFDDMSKEQQAQFDKALAIADGIQLYRQAGRTGAAANWREHADNLDRQGGMTPEAALALGRYRMWKQGLPVIPNSPTVPLTPQERGAALLAASPEEKRRIVDEDETNNYNSQQDFYGSLVKKKQPSDDQAAPSSEPVGGM